jgi:hypothetical protein
MVAKRKGIPFEKENEQAMREHPEGGILNVECGMWKQF